MKCWALPAGISMTAPKIFEIIQNANLDLPKTIWQNSTSIYHQPGVWLRTALIKDIGCLDEDLHYCFDGDLMMRYLYEHNQN